jgi:hypothetical protein
MNISFKWIEATSKHAHLSNNKDLDVDFVIKNSIIEEE